MRTKLTLLSAAALAAGLLSSHAQVFSANVVGYYNITVPKGGFNFIGNQLQGPNGDNTINGQLVNGFVSDPNGITNTTLYYWNGSTFATYQWYTAADSGYPTNAWLDGSGNPATVSLNQGAGAFLYNPVGGVATTNPIVGQVVQGTVHTFIAQGFNSYSIPFPIGTNVDSTLVNFPGHSPNDGNGNTYDVLYQWTGSGFRTATWEDLLDGDGTHVGFYDGSGNATQTNASWNIPVGSAFFIYHTNPNNVTNWSSSFTVQ